VKFLRQAAVLLVLIISLFLFPSVPATLGYLHAQLFSFLGPQDSPSALKAKFDREASTTPFGGEYGLPRHVQVIIALLRNNQATSFSLSPEVRKDAETFQRMIEGSYPIQYAEHSSDLIHREEEPVSPGCKALTKQNGVVLAYCP
jgi:hypothetical protein